MTSTANRARTGKPWWRTSRGRNRVWLTLLVIGVTSGGVYLWANRQNGTNETMGAEGVPLGAAVKSVELEDSRSGQMFDLGQYLGKRDVVIVAYMGEFCPGCSELIGELQKRAGDFEAANAQLVVLGYETGKIGRDTAAKHGVTAYPLLQEGTPYTFTRSIGMWSDMMEMPWMGYVIVGASGRIVAGEQTGLSEARGAAPANVDKILAAVSASRTGTRGATYSDARAAGASGD